MGFKLIQHEKTLNAYNLSVNCGEYLTQVSGKFNPGPLYKEILEKPGKIMDN